MGQLSFWLHSQIFQKLDILSPAVASLLLAHPEKRKCFASWRNWWWFHRFWSLCIGFNRLDQTFFFSGVNMCVLCIVYMNHRWRYNELNIDAINYRRWLICLLRRCHICFILLIEAVPVQQMEGGDKKSDFLSFSPFCRPLQACLDWLRYTFCIAK